MKSQKNKAIAITQEEIWSQDRQEKTTIYKFSDGSTSREIEKILAVKAKPTYEKGIQKIEVTYGDGTKSLITNFPIDQKISWGSDHVTKKTIDVFADGSKNLTLERVEPKLSQPKYDGHLQTIQKQYADGYSQTIVNSAIKTTVKWSDDHITKGVTYIFPDQTENTVVSKVLPVVTKVIYEGRLQLKFLRYGDGYETIEKNQPLSSKVTWEEDHVTRRTEFVYADGARNSITEKINPTSTKTSYTFDRQTKVVTYADGYVDTQTEKALSSRVIWGNDHVTKTTTFRFKDGSLHEEIEKVPPVIQTPVYKSNEQKIVSVFGDGTTSTAINLATRMEDNWSRAKTERQITYEFPDGTKHTEYFLLNAEGVLVNLEDAVRSKEAKDDAKFSVKKFAFEGNTKFTSDELNQFLAKWVRDDVDMKSLKIAATVIANKYREVGYLAKAEVPTQEVKDGVVKLNVVESRLSEVVSADPNNKTPVHALAIGMVKNAQMKDEVIHLDRIDKAAMLLSEIPGVQADLSLRPGEKKGETQAVVQIAPGKVMDGFVALDNAGARSTGYERVMSQVNMSSALDRAEQITTLVLQSKGSEFVKVGYSEPVGLSGWRLTYVDNTSSTITAASLTVTATQVSKQYDGTLIASGTGVIGVLAGAAAGDSINTTGSQAYLDKNVGASNKAVRASGVTIKDGANVDMTANYAISYVDNTTSTITAANLQIVGVAAQNKSYDASSSATLIGSAKVTPIGTDQVTVTGVGVGVFDNKNVGANKNVTVSGLALSGIDAVNYRVIQPTGVSANITPAAMLISATADSRTYNATSTSSQIPVVHGLQGTDSVSGLSQIFDGKNAGSRILSVSGYIVKDGNGGGNYEVTTRTANGNIGKADLKISGVGANNKTYDTTTQATLFGKANVRPYIGDDVKVNAADVAAKFVSKSVGNDKSVLVDGYTLSGIDANNYNVLQPSGLKADIIPTQENLAAKVPDIPSATLSKETKLSTLNASNDAGLTRLEIVVPSNARTTENKIKLQIPQSVADYFKDSQENLLVKTLDGEQLPGWIQFDAKSMIFSINSTQKSGSYPLSIKSSDKTLMVNLIFR